jgi:hypothetical protein
VDKFGTRRLGARRSFSFLSAQSWRRCSAMGRRRAALGIFRTDSSKGLFDAREKFTTISPVITGASMPCSSAPSPTQNRSTPRLMLNSAGLLKHIAMEEKILLPAAQKLRAGEPLPVAPKLRLDHGALAALLVPTPTRPVMAAIQAILRVHNPSKKTPAVCTVSARNWREPRPIGFCASCKLRRT